MKRCLQHEEGYEPVSSHLHERRRLAKLLLFGEKGQGSRKVKKKRPRRKGNYFSSLINKRIQKSESVASIIV